MKRTILLTTGILVVALCLAQQPEIRVHTSTGFEPEEASMTFSIDNPEPRVGEWTVLTFCFFPIDSMLRSGIDTAAYMVESYSNPCFNISIVPKDTGIQSIEPLRFSFNGMEFLTDTILVRVIPEMKAEPGCSIRFLMMEDEYIVIVEEVRHAPVRYITIRDSFGRKQQVNRAAQRGELAELDEDAVAFCGSVKRFSSRLLVPDEYPKTRKSKSWMLYRKSYSFSYSTCQRLEPDKKYFRNLPENTSITISDYISGK
ncbi:MAG: hypothetical protein R6V49_03005 [Bacteroidales bacterium]